jgi:hypothetical protein
MYYINNKKYTNHNAKKFEKSKKNDKMKKVENATMN